ncbi:MAG: hypothetical protein IPO40_01365 [Fibrobacteres bacterium]|nr:hypothetical protein [Fibrobacterota bacterium]
MIDHQLILDDTIGALRPVVFPSDQPESAEIGVREFRIPVVAVLGMWFFAAGGMLPLLIFRWKQEGRFDSSSTRFSPRLAMAGFRAGAVGLFLFAGGFAYAGLDRLATVLDAHWRGRWVEGQVVDYKRVKPKKRKPLFKEPRAYEIIEYSDQGSTRRITCRWSVDYQFFEGESRGVLVSPRGPDGDVADLFSEKWGNVILFLAIGGLVLFAGVMVWNAAPKYQSSRR